MAKIYPVAAIAALLLLFTTGCSKEEMKAQKPVYFNISQMYVNTDYPTEGTSHAKITTVWLVVNGESVGAFELPATPPVILKEGKNDITFYEGITMNGVDASRAIYDALTKIDTVIEYTPSDKEVADTIQFSELSTSYESFKEVVILENFDSQGLRLQATDNSDTTVIKVLKSEKPEECFVNDQKPSENNGNSGVIYTTSSKDIGEVATVDAYTLPGGGSNVYVELNYRCNQPFVVGVIAETSSGIEQTGTVQVNAKEDWNKIYINLVTEVSSYITDADFKIFIYTQHSESLGSTPGYVFLDNMKLIY